MKHHRPIFMLSEEIKNDSLEEIDASSLLSMSPYKANDEKVQVIL